MYQSEENLPDSVPELFAVIGCLFNTEITNKRVQANTFSLQDTLKAIGDCSGHGIAMSRCVLHVFTTQCTAALRTASGLLCCMHVLATGCMRRAAHASCVTARASKHPAFSAAGTPVVCLLLCFFCLHAAGSHALLPSLAQCLGPCSQPC